MGTGNGKGGGSGLLPAGSTSVGDKGHLSILLAAISTAAAQRRLTITCGLVTFVLDCGQRQVLRVIAVQPPGFPGSRATQLSPADPDERAELATCLADMLRAFLRLKTAVVVTVETPPLRYSSKEPGFGADEIRAWLTTDRTN